jgi:hypothetical protein
VPANKRDPSLNGFSGVSGSMNSARPTVYGTSSSCLGALIACTPVRCAMRDARPFSFFGTSCSQTLSLRRWMNREAFTPQASRAVRGKRSCENGMRISAVQPSASVDTAASHTASHELSSHVSLWMTASACDPAALTVNIAPVR